MTNTVEFVKGDEQMMPFDVGPRLVYNGGYTASPMYKKIQIKHERAKNIRQGHPWIFSHALLKTKGLQTGDLCEVYVGEEFLGIGYYNAETDIAIRILTRRRTNIDRAFFRERFAALQKQKETFLGDTNAYRLVFGEGDNIPGLIVDVYDTVLVLQYHTAGIEQLHEYITDALMDVCNPSCIYVKTNVQSRKREGLVESEGGVVYGSLPEEVEITEHGNKFLVNIAEGQKTGFFLDQRENRLSLVQFAEGRTVLNCFCYTGGFSVYAAETAAAVTSVDISKPAIAQTEKNLKRNGIDPKKNPCIAADVFDFLKELREGSFDMIILDPPSFAKNKRQVQQAIKAYITINSKALEKLPGNGILVSSSCTAHVDETTFLKILNQSAINTGCQLKVLYSAYQPLDHPYNLNFPEGRYLKFFILQKLPVL